MIASLPGEPTVEVGRRAKAAVLKAAGGAGVKRAVVAGIANEFILHLTTPQEYERQHYEGGSTLYGLNASSLLIDGLGDLVGRMARGEPAPEAYAFDPRNGVTGDGPAFPGGAEAGAWVTQPSGTGEVRFSWRGAPRGFDRPLDKPFLVVERAAGTGWARVTDDLGLHWSVDDQGVYTGFWTVRPGSTSAGTHRIRVTAKRFELVSEPFPAG